MRDDKKRMQVAVDMETHTRLIRYKAERQLSTGDLRSLGNAIKELLDEHDKAKEAVRG